MTPDQKPNPFEAGIQAFTELKRVHRHQLLSLPPDEAQADVECILYPRLWRVENAKQLDWPGDWADEESGE
jgi:hypothetical protein